MNNASTPTCLGVLGGMGPLAGALFLTRLIALTPASRDQDHIPVLLRSDPRIPDRSAAMMSGGKSPLPDMMQGIALLEDAGADCIVIPCNTAHLWYAQLAANSKAPVLHIVDAVLRDIRSHGLHAGKVGLLGTPATLALNLYQPVLREAGYEVIVPLPGTPTLTDCVSAIGAVKANRMHGAFEHGARSINALIDQGAQAVVLGCTELPLAIPIHRRQEFACVLTDSVDALARQVLEIFRPGATSFPIASTSTQERSSPCNPQ